MTDGAESIFAGTEEFPNPDAQRRLNALVGMEERIDRLIAVAEALLDPAALEIWSNRVHGGPVPAAEAVADRTPLYVFAGDVGVGKTEVAELLGQAIAVRVGCPVTLFPLSLTARGRGAVGEMTTLMTGAFARVSRDFMRARPGSGVAGSLGVLLIDEADALAQSREMAQMHHEDRAGVNALLRGIDGLRRKRLPVLTILCTNRLEALDPAVQRRAAMIEMFDRPNLEQRSDLLARLLAGTRLTLDDMRALALATGEQPGRPYGFTYSDLRQRLVPEVTLAAFQRNSPITADLAFGVLTRTQPTRPFELVRA